MDTMRRVEVIDDAQLSTAIFYIHKNAVHHQLVSRIEDWSNSSYHSFLNTTPTFLLREEVLGFFGGKEGFIKFHQQAIYPKDDFLEN